MKPFRNVDEAPTFMTISYPTPPRILPTPSANHFNIKLSDEEYVEVDLDVLRIACSHAMHLNVDHIWLDILCGSPASASNTSRKSWVNGCERHHIIKQSKGCLVFPAGLTALGPPEGEKPDTSYIDGDTLLVDLFCRSDCQLVRVVRKYAKCPLVYQSYQLPHNE